MKYSKLSLVSIGRQRLWMFFYLLFYCLYTRIMLINKSHCHLTKHTHIQLTHFI